MLEFPLWHNRIGSLLGVLRHRFNSGHSGLRIWHCLKLQCRSQVQLRSSVAMAMVWADSCSSNSTPAWELPYAMGEALKKKKKKKKERKKERKEKKKRFLLTWESKELTTEDEERCVFL